MTGLTAASRFFSAAHWIRLPPARARCVRHLFGIGATLAAAKVVLATVGVTLFVAEEGAAGLPFFYVAFAPVGILLSFGLGAVIDRAPRIRLAQAVFAVLLLGAIGLRLLPALGLAGSGFALLAVATVFEIVLEIVFWVVVASYLDAFELRRATPLLYAGLAAGGAAGGLAARLAAGLVAPADLLFLLLPLAALVTLQLQAALRQLETLPESAPDQPAPASRLAGAMQIARLFRRYPLALLIALNALLVTLLFGLTEFLILSIYEARFASEAELARFLSLLFAVTQVVEFALLFTLTRLLLERTAPLLRNLAFPATSLGAIGWLLLDPKLATAVVAQINAEALSNALFLPVNNANYTALPLGFQGRARTVSEGVFFPTGLALAGLVLWGAGSSNAPFQAEFATFVLGLVFLLVSAGVGLLFLPTLLANVRSGLAPTPAGAVTPRTAPTPSEVRRLLNSRDPALCLLGLDHARRVDLHTLEEALCALARRPDPAIRAALADLIAAAPEDWRSAHLDVCLRDHDPEAQKLALLVMLIRRAPAAPGPLGPVLNARDPVVVAIGQLALDGPDAGLAPGIDDPRVVSELLETAVAADRPDLVAGLLPRVGDAEPRLLRRALAMVRRLDGGRDEEVAAGARRWLRHRDGSVRAEAVTTCGRLEGVALRPVVTALDDPDGRVRRAAADVLARHGDRALAPLRGAVRTVAPGTADAVRALARIRVPRARRALAETLRGLRDDAVRTDWMRWQATRATLAPDSPLAVALDAHRRRLVEVAVAAVLATADASLARHLREVFAGSDRRARASAFEILAARPAAQRVPEGLAVLRHLLFEGDTALRDAPVTDAREALLAAARHSMGPWVRLAAARTQAGWSGAGTAGKTENGDVGMAMREEDFERVFALRRTPLFRDLDLDALFEVARAVRTRSWLCGDEVVAAGSSRRGLLILETGRLTIDGEEVQAPAHFGEATLAGQPLAWPRIAALEDARVGFLDALVFDELRQDHHELVVQLCRFLARRVHELEAGAGPAPTRGAGLTVDGVG